MRSQRRNQRRLARPRRTIEQISSVVWNPELGIALFRGTKICYVLDKVFLLARLQHNRTQQSWRIAFNVIPAVVVGVQIRADSLPPQVAVNHVIHKLLQQAAIASNGSKG